MTLKQEAFCREYLIDFNATQAAIRAGYAKKSARQTASENLSKPDIQNRISKLAKTVVHRHEVTIERLVQEYACCAFLDPIELFNDDGTMKSLNEMSEAARRSLAGIEITEKNAGTRTDPFMVDVTKVKIIDKRAALSDLGKYLGMFIDRVDHSSKDGTMATNDKGTPEEYAAKVAESTERILRKYHDIDEKAI